MPEECIFHLSCKRGKNDHFVVKKRAAVKQGGFESNKMQIGSPVQCQASIIYICEMKGASLSSFLSSFFPPTFFLPLCFSKLRSFNSYLVGSNKNVIYSREQAELN